MKKIVSILMIAMLVVLSSCGNRTTKSEVATDVEEVATDSLAVVDSTATETVVVE